MKKAKIFGLLLLSIFLFSLLSLPAISEWLSGYNYQKQITINNLDNSQTLRKNTTINLTLDTSTLISAGKMQSDCDDLRISWKGTGSLIELDRRIYDCNTATTMVEFMLQRDIPASESDNVNYTLFYGNAGASAPSVNLENIYYYFNDFETGTIGSAPANWVCTEPSKLKGVIKNGI